MVEVKMVKTREEIKESSTGEEERASHLGARI